MLKEYIARGNYIYPPEPTMRLTTDLFEYCQQRVPRWNTISISGYHFREKGCSAVQEVAFTLSSGIAYVQAAIDKGLSVDDFAPRLAFFFNGHNNVFQEVAKFRAARRMWAHIMRERFGATNPKATMLRFHTQTGGVTLTAQQPENNIVRVALQGFAAVCGGTQSLHTNGFDEALALPTERAAKIALRTQQILAHESGATDTVDPFAGSYFVESLTDEIEARANELIAKVDALGGSVQRDRVHHRRDRRVGVGLPGALPHRPGHRRRRQRLRGRRASRSRTCCAWTPSPSANSSSGWRPSSPTAIGALVERRLERAARGRARPREPAAGDPPGAEGPLLAGRGVRRDAGRVRRLRADLLSFAPRRRTSD